MEINKPDTGIFKGFGNLETKKYVNKKAFPNNNNVHRFEYGHNHPNEYKTTFQNFKRYDREEYKYHKVNKNSNESQVHFGNRLKLKTESEAQNCYRKYNFSLPPKQIKQKEEGLGFNEYQQRTGEKVGYVTTSNENHNPFRKLTENQNIKYKYSRTDRFNPITGESKSIASTFAYEDFIPNTNKAYKANNFTMIPTRNQRYDIISGRKLTEF